MRDVANSGRRRPGFSTANEDSNATGFESDDAGFMVNWPFVWPRALAAVEAGTLEQSVPDDYGWTLYPRVDADTPSAPPLRRDQPRRRRRSASTSTSRTRPTECITSDENQAYYFETNGNPAASDRRLRRPGGPEGLPAWRRSSGSPWTAPRRGR